MPSLTLPSSLWETVKCDFKGLFPEDVFQMWFEPVLCLETTEDANDYERHANGVQRLTALVQAGDLCWLTGQFTVQSPSKTTFDLLATSSGKLIPTNLPRMRPQPVRSETADDNEVAQQETARSEFSKATRHLVVK